MSECINQIPNNGMAGQIVMLNMTVIGALVSIRNIVKKEETANEEPI